MSQRLATNRKFLHSVCKCKPDEWKSRIKKASNDEIKSMVDLTLNVLKKNVPVSAKKVQLIRQNRHVLRHLCHPSHSLKSKKRYLQQRGSGFGALFSGLGSLFSKGATTLSRSAG